MKILFGDRQFEMLKAVNDYGNSCEGIDRSAMLNTFEKSAEGDLREMKKSLDRWNRVRKFVRKPPFRRLILITTGYPDSSPYEVVNPTYTHYVTGAEVYPPFPSSEQDEIVVAGLVEVLNGFTSVEIPQV